MTRLAASLQTDLRVQLRNGFYFVSGFIVLIFTALLSQLPKGVLDLSLVVPSILLVNFVLTTFFFVGALVLLEKSEGTIYGLVVTPLRVGEYLLAKVASLTGLATLESALVVLFVFGLPPNMLPLLLGMLLLGTLFTLLGFVVTARFRSINEYLLPAGFGVMLLLLPLLQSTGLLSSPLFHFHPAQPAVTLLRSAYTSVSTLELVYAVLGSLSWAALSFLWAKRVFVRHIVGGN